MELPSPFYTVYAFLLYCLLIYILVVGFIQYFKLRKGKVASSGLLKRSLLPIGVIAVVIGVLGVVDQVKNVFEAISVAGDISPSIVSGGIALGYPHLTLGLLCLIITLLFKYSNQ